MLALAKRIPALDGLVERGALEAAGFDLRERASAYIGYSNFARIAGLKTLYGATLGIVGMGEVGRKIAGRAAPFGITTLYYQRRALSAADEQSLGARHAPLHDLMAQSDYIVVQLPLNESTRGIIGAEALSHANPGAYLVNCARAELVDHAALVAALATGTGTSGHINMAMFDGKSARCPIRRTTEIKPPSIRRSQRTKATQMTVMRLSPNMTQSSQNGPRRGIGARIQHAYLQPTLILRGFAFSAFGKVNITTPSLNWALMRSWSMSLESSKLRA